MAARCCQDCSTCQRIPRLQNLASNARHDDLRSRARLRAAENLLSNFDNRFQRPTVEDAHRTGTHHGDFRLRISLSTPAFCPLGWLASRRGLAVCLRVISVIWHGTAQAADNPAPVDDARQSHLGVAADLQGTAGEARNE